jgi:hypothetical protein
VPTVVHCPQCSKAYRLGAEIPESFACTACGTAIDLSQAQQPTRHAVPAARPRRAMAPRKTQVAVGSAVIGIFVVCMVAVRILFFAGCCARGALGFGIRGQFPGRRWDGTPMGASAVRDRDGKTSTRSRLGLRSSCGEIT